MSSAEAEATTSSSSSTLFPSTTHTLLTPSFPLHYTLHGDPASPQKLLLIMGLLTDGDAWDPQVEYFSKRGFQCVTFDNRGVGKSGTPGLLSLHSYTTANMANDARRLVEHLGWETCHVVGVSMGGMIALEFASMVPAPRIASLTLVVTHAGGFGGLAPFNGVLTMAKSLFTSNEEVRLKSIMEVLYTKATLADSKRVAELQQRHFIRMQKRIPPKLVAVLGHTLAVYRHYLSYPRLLKLRFSEFPILVMVGEEDRLVRLSNSHMLARVLGAELLVVHEGGHGLLAEQPEITNKGMEEFFRKSKQRGKRNNVTSDTEHTSIEDEVSSSDDSTLSSLQSSLADSSVNSSPDASVELQAVALACSHSVHCSLHNLSGFFTGFFPAFFFRWLFYESSSVNPLASSRLQQSVRFGCLVGLARAAWRAAQCIRQAYRARQWIKQHNLMGPHTHLPSHPTCPCSAPSADESIRRCIPAGAGFEFPIHSLVWLGVCVAMGYQQVAGFM